MKLLLTIIAAVLVVGTALADPIHDAAGNGDLAGVQAELDKGVEVDAKMQGGYTPLHSASRGHKEIAELLIANGADVNAKTVGNGWTPLHYAADEGHKEIIELLIDNGADVNAKDYLGWTPLLRAAKGGHRRLAELLIAKGADVNANSNRDATPLHHAAKEGHKEIAELLIAKGADVNAKGSDGSSPLHWSALFGQKEVVELLIAKDADVNAKDEYGMTPLGFTTLPDNPYDTAETADLLRKHGGKTGAELALMPPRLVQHGRFAFSFDAKEGKVYEVQDSFDLLNWEVIKTYTGTGDLVRFDEERDHDPPKWFYRVKVVE
jgi:ankyrin repeat protein